MASHYPDALDRLQGSCRRYRDRALTLDDFKSEVWKAASAVVAVEEAVLRRFLQAAEAELDSIQFTTDDSKIFGRTLQVVDEIEAKLREWR